MKFRIRLLSFFVSFMLIVSFSGCSKKEFTNKIDGFEFLFDTGKSMAKKLNIGAEMQTGDLDLRTSLTYELYDEGDENVIVELYGRKFPVEISSKLKRSGESVTRLRGYLRIDSKIGNEIVFDADTMEIIVAHLAGFEYEPFAGRITTEEELLNAADVFMASHGIKKEGYSVSYYLTDVVGNVRDGREPIGYKTEFEVEEFKVLDETQGYKVYYTEYVGGFPTENEYYVAFRCDGTVFSFDVAPKQGEYPEIDFSIEEYENALEKLLDSLPVYERDDYLEYNIRMVKLFDGTPMIRVDVVFQAYYSSKHEKDEGKSVVYLNIYTPIEINE